MLKKARPKWIVLEAAEIAESGLSVWVFLSANERIKVHEEIEHSVCCSECQDKFVSLPYLRYHIETFHDAKCGDCLSFCEKKCFVEIAMGIELAAEKVMEDGLAEKTEAAAAAAEDLEECIKKKFRDSESQRT